VTNYDDLGEVGGKFSSLILIQSERPKIIEKQLGDLK
jgi:hypothetical protein